MKGIPNKCDTLDNALAMAWAMLERGVARTNDPFHTPVLGTRGSNDTNLRTVILRQFDPSNRVLVCHTEARAGKVREIRDFDRVSWLFFHPEKKLQLRISGPATLHTDDEFADRQWRATTLTSRLNYCAADPPGTPIEKPSSGLPDFLMHKLPTLLESERGRRNFTAIRARIETMDWLLLGITGNRRARFDWTGKSLEASWLIP